MKRFELLTPALARGCWISRSIRRQPAHAGCAAGVVIDWRSAIQLSGRGRSKVAGLPGEE